jgi:hypothetical protein
MGAIKEWLFSEKVCTVCSTKFTPSDVISLVPQMDYGHPVCSIHCYNKLRGEKCEVCGEPAKDQFCSIECEGEYHEVMNALADMVQD